MTMRIAFLLTLLLILAGCNSAEPEPTPTEIPTMSLADAAAIQTSIIEAVTSEFPVALTAAELDAPLPLSDWVESDPSTQGMDAELLGSLAPFLESDLTYIHSVVVVRNDNLVYEYYKEGRSAESADIVWSVTKSITSLLIGIAADDGLLTLDQPISELLSAEQQTLITAELSTATVRDVLTMRSGISCPNDGCHDSTLSAVLTDDVVNEPGTAFRYDTSSTQLLGGVLENVTGMDIHDYSAEKLFIPLGIVPPPWQIDAEGNPFGGKGLIMLPRDMAKIGQLILEDGVWQGEQIVSSDYLAEATQNQLGADESEEYGYLFWPGELGEHEMVAAVGYGGQLINVVPSLDLVVVVTANFSPPRDGSRTILEPFILDAIEQ